MIGHACTLSRTNSNGIVWVCECGAIGDVVPMPALIPGARRLSERRVALCETVARESHGRHLEDVRADIGRRSHAELARIGRLSVFANRTLQHRGRWGHP